MVWDRLRSWFDWVAGPPPFPQDTAGLREAATPAEAARVFRHLSSMGGIAFRYTPDGCHARAHLMCRELFDMGFVPQKAWALEDDKMLKVKLGKSKVRWCFHVAPALTVQMPDGRREEMVFDPSLFDGPVTLARWGDVMHAKPGQLQITPCGKPPKGYWGDYTVEDRTKRGTDAEAKALMLSYLDLQKPKKSWKVFHSEFQSLLGQGGGKAGQRRDRRHMGA